MKTNLKYNIWIEQFDEKDLQVLCGIEAGDSGYDLLYEGKTSKIPRELAKKCFDWGYDDLELIFTSLDEAIQQVCSKIYCIIYKIS